MGSSQRCSSGVRREKDQLNLRTRYSSRSPRQTQSHQETQLAWNDVQLVNWRENVGRSQDSGQECAVS